MGNHRFVKRLRHDFVALILLCVSVGVFAVQAHSFEIHSVTPSQGKQGENVDVVIEGVDFWSDSTFEIMSSDIMVTNLVIVDSNTATATLEISPNAALGFYGMYGRHGVGSDKRANLEDAFEVIDEGSSSSGGAGLGETTLITTGAALKDGEVWVWGFRGSSQQGNGTMVVASNATPAKVQSLSNVKQLTGGAYHLLALDANGDVYGWGQSGYGETGCAPTQGIYVSTPCKVLSNAVQVAAGEYYSIALDENGQVWTWGHNLYGQLGNGATANSRTPVAVNLNGEKTRLIGGAYEGAFAVTEEGHVWAWGDNEASGLGFQGSIYGVQRIVRTPTHVPNLDQYANDITHIAGGNGWGEALLKGGRVIGWGLHAALGIGVRKTNISGPEPVVIMDNVSKLFARYVGSFALTNNGKLFSWGQTGGSAFEPIYGDYWDVPEEHVIHGKPVAIGGGKEHIFYQTEDGRVYGVGYNDLYKLDQSKCCGPNVQWPGSEITFQ